MTTNVERMTAKLYYEDSEYFLSQVRYYCKKARLREHLESCTYFNSINILASQDLDIPALLLSVEDENISKHGYSSPNVYYFIYNECFKVNIHLIDVEYIDTHVLYTSYSPLGILLKVHAATLNIGYGHKGLKFLHPETHITHNIQDIFKILGYEKVPNNFISVEDVYRFISSSKFFSPTLFTEHTTKLKNVKGMDAILDSKAFNVFLGTIKKLPDKKVNMSVFDIIKSVETVYPTILDVLELDTNIICKEDLICKNYSSKYIAHFLGCDFSTAQRFGSRLRAVLRNMELDEVAALDRDLYLKTSFDEYYTENA